MNLKNLNVQEMNHTEMLEVEGGFLAFLAVALLAAGAVLIGLIVDHQHTA